jgi:hypothetical protein
MTPRVLLAAAVLGLAAASAHAAVQIQFIHRGTPKGSATQTSTGYSGYTIRLIETTGANITAIDMESPGNGLFGPFVQRWGDSNEDGVYADKTINVANNAQNLSPNVFNNDSHLLFVGNPPADSNYVGKIGFDEDVGGAPFLPPGSPNPPFPNNGTSGIVVSTVNGYIKGAYGIAGPAQSSTLDLAYIVLWNDIVGLSRPGYPGPGFGFVTVAVAGQNPQRVFIGIPEPGAASLLGFTSLETLVRRRRAT